MKKNGKELIFNQLITEINFGKFKFDDNEKRIAFLSKGIVVALSDKIIFYDFKKLSQTFIQSINEKDKEYLHISKLLNDKFCIYTRDETLIYQLNNKDFSVTLLKKINVNLVDLFELEKDKYVNVTKKYLYIWKELKSIFKPALIIFISNIILSMIFQLILPKNINSYLYYFIHFFFGFIFSHTIRIHIYLINPYKRIDIKRFIRIEKCGNNLCCLKTFYNIMIFNHYNYKIIKEIISSNESPYLWDFVIINENIILLINKLNNRMKIYDIKKNKIIKDSLSNIIMDLHNTFKYGNNSFVSIQKKDIIIWEFKFESNDIIILNKISKEYLDDQIILMNVINNKLFILKKQYLGQNFDNKSLHLYIYK